MTLFDEYNQQQAVQDGMSASFVFIASMTYMASADGEVHERELMSIVNWFGSQPEVIKACEQAAQYARETPVEDFLMAAAPILDRDQKLCLLANLLDVLFADGFADPNEQELFFRFCEAFRIDEEEYRPFIQMAIIKNNRALFSHNTVKPSTDQG